MKPEFWQERWREGRIGFHQAQVSNHLRREWPGLQLPPGTTVFVPLCGKSLDMRWLAAQGHQVIGAELSTIAVEQFFAEHGLTPAREPTPHGTWYRADRIAIWCGDLFHLPVAQLARCAAVFDRAALVALPPDMRHSYCQFVYGQLPADFRGLLISLDYPQEQKDGPPFSVDAAEVQALFAPLARTTLLRRENDLEPGGKFEQAGVTRLETLVYRLEGLAGFTDSTRGNSSSNIRGRS